VIIKACNWLRFLLKLKKSSIKKRYLAMKIRSLKTVYGILVFLLLAGPVSTVHATTLTPASGTTLAATTINVAYTSATLTAGGCTGGTYTWTATGLPAGLNLNNTTGTTNTIKGTPTASGSFTINVTVTHTGCAPNSVTNTYYLTVNTAVTLTPGSGTRTTIAPSAITNVAYTSTTIFTAGGGTPPYTWTTPTALPAGLSLSSTTGNNIYITGTTAVGAGNKNFSIRVTDSAGADVQYNYRVTVVATGCDFVSGVSTGDISFGNIDPSTTGTIYGTITTGVQFTCSSALAYTITVSPASGWQLTSGSNTMAYTLGVALGGTYGTTAVNVFPASSSNIVQGQFESTPAGSYSNASTITVTISWTGGSIVASLPVGSVTGTVISTCGSLVNGAFSTLSISPSNNANQSFAVATPATVSCTKNTSTTSITASSLYGSSHTTPVSCTGSLLTGFTMQEPVSGDTINYSFQCNASITGLGFGSSTNVPLGIGATVLAADVISANYASGKTYADTVTMTINY